MKAASGRIFAIYGLVIGESFLVGELGSFPLV